MTARAVMVLGTTSGAGKSWLATARCRWYARQGLKVAPFKAQNMSNNARVVPGAGGELGEIGSAQYFQALAANVRPEVRMNPVPLKPEHDSASQVVVLGQVRADLAPVPWRERSERLWPFARDALQALMRENDVVVIEGAGSPAEINLHASDCVNMRTAREVNAACLLVTDIDRGGAFAHLFGTHQLLPADERALICGYVLNRFRGDAALLAPVPQQLQELTGVATLAVLPMWRGHGLPEEDGVFDEAPCGDVARRGVANGDAAGVQITIVAFPRISNLDEFQPLRECPGVRLRWARTAGDLAGADWVELPGSKHTHFERAKLLRHTRAHFGALSGGWCGLAGVVFEGHEIRHDRTGLAAQADASADSRRATPAPTHAPTTIALRNAVGEAIGCQCGNALGPYAHGLFESPAVMRALFGAEPRTLDSVFDGLADFIDRHFEPGALMRLLGDSPPTQATA